MFATHVDKRILTKEVEKVATRNGYGEGLVAAAEQNDKVVALCSDLTESTRTHLFKEAFPERFVQTGIAEQNMASVASGMAAMGRVPFIASYAMFSPGRNWEQIRTTIAYNESNVKIVGAHAGISVGPDGATHQAIEDMALMRVMPGMVVLAPADSIEAKKATMAAAAYEGPVYIRLGREKTPVVTTESSPFAIGVGEVMMEKYAKGDVSVGIVSTGTLLHNALAAATTLNEKGVAVSVAHLGTIKPLDTALLEELLGDHDMLVTVEEHQVAGGLGGAVAEFVSATKTPKRVVRIGIEDVFGESGTPEELLAHHKLDADSIVARIESEIS